MAVSSYYGRSKAQGSTQKVMLNLGEGLNEFLPPMSIRDGQLSACKNFYSTDGMSLKTVEPHINYTGTAPRIATERMVYYGYDSYAIPSMYASIVGLATRKASYLMGGSGFDISSLAWEIYDDVVYGVSWAKQAKTVALYVGGLSGMLSHEIGGGLAGTSIVTVPMTNAMDIALANSRVFILDDKNTLWWSKGGDETTWYGATTDNQYAAEDAGYWYIPTEDTMRKIVAFNDSLYIFGRDSIWLFSGFSPETFQLQRVVSGIGIGFTGGEKISEKNGILYFTDRKMVYAFNGSATPTVISESIVSNDSYINGITGGITPTTGFMASLLYPDSIVCDNNFLYLYNGDTEDLSNEPYGYIITTWLYIFDIKRKTWFKRQGFNHNAGNYDGALRLYSSITDNGLVSWSGWTLSGAWSTILEYAYGTVPPTGATLEDFEAFFVSKAFTSSPSRNQTLSGIYFTWQALDALDTNMEVYISDSAKQQSSDTILADIDWENFTRIYDMSSYVSNQKPQILYVPIPSNFTMSKAPFFRVAVKTHGCQIVVYSMEIHYRVVEGSR